MSIGRELDQRLQPLVLFLSKLAPDECWPIFIACAFDNASVTVPTMGVHEKVREQG